MFILLDHLAMLFLKSAFQKKKFHFLLNQGYIIICPWKNIVDDFIFNFSL